MLSFSESDTMSGGEASIQMFELEDSDRAENGAEQSGDTMDMHIDGNLWVNLIVSQDSTSGENWWIGVMLQKLGQTWFENLFS